MKMRDREQLARECAEIEKRGGCVRDYLRGLGCVSPWGTWHRLQKEELGRSDAQITDGKGKGMKQPKLTDAQKNKAVRIAIEGGDPREYLKECGSTNADAMWWSIKRKIKEEDPEKYEKLPKKLQGKEPAPKTERGGGVAEMLEEEIMKDGNRETEAQIPEGMRLKVSAAEGLAGRWIRHADRLMLQVYRDGKEVVVSDMTPLEWEAATEELRAVIELFGMGV